MYYKCVIGIYDLHDCIMLNNKYSRFEYKCFIKAL